MNRLLGSNLLRGWWKCGLGLSLALAASAVSSAGDVEWRAASDARPAAAAPAAGPAVTIGAPLPLPAPGGLRPVSYSPDAPVIFRAQMPDNPKMMPVGIPDGPNDPPAKKPTTVLPAPKPLLPPHDAVMGGDPCPCGPAACGNPDGCCGGCLDACCGVPHNRWWVRGEYLMWWLKGQAVPPLVTTGSPTDAVPGALGQPHTAVLFGGETLGNGMRSGGRLSVGWWLDDEHSLGIDASGFALSARSVNFFAGSFGAPALFRPFFNSGFAFDAGTGTFVPITPSEDAEKVAFPDQLAGNVAVRLRTQLWGAELNARTNLFNGCCGCWGYSVDGYTGVRALGLSDGLYITENLASIIPGVPGGFIVQDSFRTQNRFIGGQIGFDTELRWRRWFLDLNTKVALGNVRETVDILGATATTDALGGIIYSRGGLLALNSNIGHYSRDRFAVLPEVGVNLGYQVTDWLRLFAGYNFLYLSNAVRAGEQVSRVVNPTLIPMNGGALQGAPQPTFAFHGTDFWAHGLNFGLEFRW
jgi:hypothetical protein